jgi:predicted NBD/HSP70 family sugar kinase
MAMRLRAANRQLMREINTSIVLGLVREHRTISRIDIARMANLSAATVSGITSGLISRNLVVEQSPGTSTGGRRPTLLAFNSQAGVALGVKVTESHIVCVDCDLDGVPLHRTDLPLPGSATPDDVTSLIAGEVATARERHAQPLFGVGVGIAGVVDRPSGVCRYSPFLHWRNVPLAAQIESATGCPVVVENDVNTVTQAFSHESLQGTGGSFVVVTLGRGVGLGMKLNGQLFRGRRGQGGEYGHITVDPNGPQCECGKRGCLESIVSIPALVRQAGQVTGERVDLQTFQQRVLSGDPTIAQVVDRPARILGESLATIVNILNPETIVLSGEGAWLASHMLGTIGDAMNAQVFQGLSGQVSLIVRERDDGFWAQGAAELLIEETLTPRLRVTPDSASAGRGLEGGVAW